VLFPDNPNPDPCRQWCFRTCSRLRSFTGSVAASNWYCIVHILKIPRWRHSYWFNIEKPTRIDSTYLWNTVPYGLAIFNIFCAQQNNRDLSYRIQNSMHPDIMLTLWWCLQKHAAALYAQAADFNKTARFYYMKAQDAYYLANAQVWNDCDNLQIYWNISTDPKIYIRPPMTTGVVLVASGITSTAGSKPYCLIAIAGLDQILMLRLNSGHTLPDLICLYRSFLWIC
jgi:hypothetical protein